MSLWGTMGPPVTPKSGTRLQKPLGNPCVAVFGTGPEGVQCKTCVHLRTTPTTQGKYYKCDLCKCTRGRATDHKVRWPACARYEEAQS